MHFSSLINLLSCKSWKIAILMSGHEIYKSRHKICKKKFLSLTSKFFIKDNLIASQIHMKEQQKRKFKQIHPEIEDGIDLRRCPLLVNGLVMQEGTNQLTKYLLVIHFDRIPICLNRPRFDLTITQASTFSGARLALFCVTTLPATLKTRSLLLLATGMGKMTLIKKARRGRDSSWIFHHCS